MTSSRSTVADVIEYDPENKALALNMIAEILEIRQGVLPEVKRKMEVSFYFHCNIGEGHGLESKEEIEKLLMRPSYCCLSIEEQETINLRNAYSYLMSHCDENQGLLEESMLRETNRIILWNIPRDIHYTKAGSYCNNPRITQFRGELYHYQQPNDMQEAVCVLLDRFNSVFMQSINTNPERNKLLSIFKCVAWLVFELLDLHSFFDGNGRLCRLLSSYVLSTCTPFPTPIYNLHTDHEFEKALIAGRKTRHPSRLTSMIIESSLVAWATHFKKESAHTNLLTLHLAFVR